MLDRFASHAEAVTEKAESMEDCIRLGVGTVIKIARPIDNFVQKVVYNGHKRSNALKFQAVGLPDGIAVPPQ